LRSRFGSRATVVQGDALEFPLPTRPWRAVGNLPYNVATPIVRRVIASEHWRRAVFMLQKEVADRLVAKPGTEAYGFLTLYVQLFATARTLMALDPGSFHPPPKVRSAVVVLEPDRKPFASEEMIELISAAFRMRRKTLVNNLTGWDYAALHVKRGERVTAVDEMLAVKQLEVRLKRARTPENLHRLALAQLAVGEREEAHRLLEEATRLRPDDAAILSDLAAAE